MTHYTKTTARSKTPRHAISNPNHVVLNILMPIRLIRKRLTAPLLSRRRPTSQRHTATLVRVPALAQRGTFHPLVFRPLAPVVPAAAGTAADGREPDDGRREGEGHGEPGGGQHARAEGAVDVVGLEVGVEGAGEGGVEDRRD